MLSLEEPPLRQQAPTAPPDFGAPQRFWVKGLTLNPESVGLYLYIVSIVVPVRLDQFYV